MAKGRPLSPHCNNNNLLIRRKLACEYDQMHLTILYYQDFSLSTLRLIWEVLDTLTGASGRDPLPGCLPSSTKT